MANKQSSNSLTFWHTPLKNYAKGEKEEKKK